MTTELENILTEIWATLQQGMTDSRDACHTPALATLSERGPALRTVVLRQVQSESRILACHADVRTAKIAEVQQSPAVSWLFYAPERKIQIRAEGSAMVHHQDAVALAAWERTNLSSRRAYCTLAAPGSVSEIPASGLPPELNDRVPTQAESEIGWPNFAVILCTITRLEWLYLSAKGHRRARFDWNGDNFEANWIIP